MVLDRLARMQTLIFQKVKLATLATASYRGRKLFLVKPTTYMNHSGRAVSYWLSQLKLPIERSLVVVDDIALPLGKLRMRPQGSYAGHNGLKSIEFSLSTSTYPRLRVGIGHDFRPGKQADYVLAPFKPQEQTSLPTITNHACEMIHAFCTLGIIRTMERYNRNDELLSSR